MEVDSPIDNLPDQGTALTSDNLAGTWASLGVPIVGKPVVIDAGLHLDLFYQAPDLKIHHQFKYADGPWVANPNPITPPAALGFSTVSWGPRRCDIFMRSPTDNGIWHYWFDGPGDFTGQFRGESLGETADATPVAVTWGPGSLHVFARFQDGAVYHNYLTGTGWTGWMSVGPGVILGLPCPVSWGPGRIDLAACGTDNSIYHKSYYEGSWHPALSWGRITDVGASTPSTPVEVSWAEGRLDLFIIASGFLRAVYHKAYVHSQQKWLPSETALDPNPYGGNFVVGTLHVVSPQADHLDVVALDRKGDVYHKAWDVSHWSPEGRPFALIGKPGDGAITGPPVLSPRGSKELMVFAAGPGGELWYWTQGILS